MKNKITLLLVFLFLSVSFSETYSQALRNVLYEKWTSSTCGPCASQNPYFESWLPAYWVHVTVVAYHVGWPSPGNDPMYLLNPVQSYDRRYYYGVNAVPCCWVDGVIYTGACAGCSYVSQSQCLTTPYNTRQGVSTPLSLDVTDQRIAGDSIRATIVLTKLSNLPTGYYYLRVMAIERIIRYTSPPGTNGEMVFPDVFRESFPNSQGTAITTTAGTENYVFTYKKNPAWVDSMIFTNAFVQNDAGHEVLNSGRPANITITGKKTYSSDVPAKFELLQNYPNPFNPYTYIEFFMPRDANVTLKVFDILGNEVKTLVEGHQRAGTYNIFFDGSELSSGVYLYKLTAGDFSQTKKMLLVK